MRVRFCSRQVDARSSRACLWAVAITFSVMVLCPAGAPAKKKPPILKTVSGIVSDDAYNPIVGASVELTDLTTGKKLAIYSADGGRYQFAGLDRDHDYTLRATNSKNIASEVRKVSSLDDRDNIVINLEIPPPK